MISYKISFILDFKFLENSKILMKGTNVLT